MELKEKSFAMEILDDYKKANKRMFWIIITILIMWLLTIGYLVWLLNDIEQDIDNIDIDNVSQIDNSTLKIGDDVWEKSE